MSVDTRAPKSLVISPNLDALLEHEDRVRRIRHAHSASSSIGSSTAPFGAGLPPPPRRGFSSPLSPTYSLRRDEAEDEESLDGNVESVVNPYINPAPRFDDDLPRTPISPPPRTSSMYVKLEPVRGRPRTPTSPITTRAEDRSSVSSSRRVASSTPTSPIATSSQHDRSPASSSSGRGTSTHDSRHSLPSLSLRSKQDSSNSSTSHHRRTRSRSRGKLVKPPPEPSSPLSSPMPTHSPTRSISSAHESFIDFDVASPIAESPSTAPPPLVSLPPSLPPPPTIGKPPIPTTPKPDFSRRRRHASPSTVVRAHSRQNSPNSPPPSLPLRAIPPDTMPPTTNFLNPTERAQLIRKSKKLTQVFGQTPGAGEANTTENSSFLDVSPVGTGKSRHRPAASMNMVGQMPASARPRQPLPWPAPDKTIYMDANGRRHSAPERDDLSVSDAPSSPLSFMDLSVSSPSSHSDEDTERETELGPDDSVSVISVAGASKAVRRKSSMTPSFADSLSPEAQAEEDRRRKRDKLAKLHRFLGSRVPANLVLGPGYNIEPAVVGIDGTLSPLSATEFGSDTLKKGWVKRRRSSSAAVLAATWASDWDRMKENLNDKEKAIIMDETLMVDMEVFGVAPPQDLYRASTPTPPGARTAPASPTATQQRNVNQSSYRRSASGKSSSRRPRTGDSGEHLLADVEPVAGTSFVYNHYQHSLNSLHDILDRNDQESLAELHQYLHDDEEQPATPTTAKSERRRSLPVLLPRSSVSSLASIASDATTTTASPDALATEFQLRRRRAAKLTQFFGVDYRELIDDVLESIEAGLDAERSRGSLNAGEAEALLQKLRTLKTRR
ncbi:hypothetical protein MIND_00524400 [Mycena indigotica]|uniref:Uncharacterized protein n=1 Tax=Mycena indigotica TaxID=2126181 RepID=A0A8H6W670_9AGAR|nr:uncharacterized protein MIND_00524400 [Mycena indigotica]KAF7307304.1 hypothetical protein MIND_00524400 [Mycena indigotica]